LDRKILPFCLKVIGEAYGDYTLCNYRMQLLHAIRKQFCRRRPRQKLLATSFIHCATLQAIFKVPLNHVIDLFILQCHSTDDKTRHVATPLIGCRRRKLQSH
jgi:hypothetical protein